MEKTTLLWLSRHELTDEQKNDLVSVLLLNGISGEFDVATENVTWENTDNYVHDIIENGKKWHDLVERHHPAVILGVFPPAAMESVNHRHPMHSPISRQDAKEREDGTKAIEFHHVRWSGNLNE